MKWMKQVFAQRYNRLMGRIGHIWGDRYWSGIVEDGEALAAGERRGVRPWYEETNIGVRPQHGERAIQTFFSLIFPLPAAPIPG
jgi:hypothetical protein